MPPFPIPLSSIYGLFYIVNRYLAVSIAGFDFILIENIIMWFFSYVAVVYVCSISEEYKSTLEMNDHCASVYVCE